MERTKLMLPSGAWIASGTGGSWSIASAKVSRSVNPGRELAFGGVCAGALEVGLLTVGPDPGLTPGMVLKAYRGDRLLGTYWLEEPEYTGRCTGKLLAYDAVSRLDREAGDFLKDLQAWPYTLEQLARELAGFCGLELEAGPRLHGDHPVEKLTLSSVTARQLMGWIGEVTGSFCQATPEGKLTFSWYTPRDGVIGPTGQDFYYQGTLRRERYQVAPVDKVQLKGTGADVGVLWPPEEQGDNAYVVSCNPLAVGDLAQGLFEALAGITYTPCTLTVPGALGIRPGEILRIRDPQGVEFTTYAMTVTEQDGRARVESTGSPRRTSVTAVNSYRQETFPGKVLEIGTSVEGLRVRSARQEEAVAELALSMEGLSLSVEQQEQKQEALQTAVTTLEQTARGLTLEVGTIIQEGVQKVRTATGFTFDEAGLRIRKSGQEMENLLDHRGMYVNRGEERILKADPEGVEARDLKARNFLIVGSHARLEDYGENRTACYWL